MVRFCFNNDVCLLDIYHAGLLAMAKKNTVAEREPLTEEQEKTVRWTVVLWVILFALILASLLGD